MDLLENAKDFLKDGPILIITDGKIESTLRVRREQAFLIRTGSSLPFYCKATVLKLDGMVLNNLKNIMILGTLFLSV